MWRTSGWSAALARTPRRARRLCPHPPAPAATVLAYTPGDRTSPAPQASQASHAQQRQINFSCVCSSSCVCMPLPSSKCRQERGSKYVFLQPTKEEEKEKKQQPKRTNTISGCTRSKIDLTKAAWLARPDELTQTFAASILEFSNLPLDATRLCINCVRKWKTHMKKKHPRALEEHNKAQRRESSGLCQPQSKGGCFYE